MARRPRKSDAEGGASKPRNVPPSNVTDDTIRESVNRIIDLQSVADAAHKSWKEADGAVKQSKKAAKALGVDIDAVGDYLKLRKQELPDVDRRHKNLARICVVMGLPTQYLLFGDASVASQVDATKIAEGQAGADVGIPSVGDLADAEAAGEAAGKAGKFAHENPHERESPKGIRWNKGWEEGQRSIAPQATSA